MVEVQRIVGIDRAVELSGHVTFERGEELVEFVGGHVQIPIQGDQHLPFDEVNTLRVRARQFGQFGIEDLLVFALVDEILVGEESSDQIEFLGG